MNPPTTEQTKLIHSQYKALSGLDVPYSMQTHYMWEAWLLNGWTEPDLACVVRYLKQRIKEGKNPPESLLPRNLIQRTDHFGENLAIARATARNSRTESPKAEIMRAAGYQDKPRDTARPIGDIVAAAKALEDLRRWRTENGL